MALKHLIAAFLSMSLAVPAAAQPDAGRAAAEIFAQEIDADGDGVISDTELQGFGDSVFASIDLDGDGAMSEEEMRDWRFGMSDLAEFRERTQAYDTAVAMAFDIFDRDNDSAVSPDEHAAAIQASADYADLDGDGALSIPEYLDGFIFNVAMRSALVP
ncbi:hypothetical protein AADZ90_014025 [Aestuariibius sp. 2305UL40-4]|uniref:hypothetical protein n=1 Tax=Aestuariibius violaceus TaxID=3234132 RepID=UPI0034707D74